MNTNLSKEKVIEDLVLFQRIKESAHAGIYKYRTKVQMDSAFSVARSQVKDSMTVQEVYKLLVDLTDFEGSLHNDTSLPDILLKESDKQEAFFPYPVKLVAGKLVLDYSKGVLPLGTEIVAINGQSIPLLAQMLGRYYTTDGFNLTGKQRALSTFFSRYYYYEYGPQTSFEVRVRTPGSSSIQTQRLAAVDYYTFNGRQQQRHSQILDSLMTPRGEHQYGFKLLGSVAILTIRTFDIGDNAKSAAHKAYKHFLDECFTTINANSAIQEVLIDVRGNGGGSDPNDMVTFSYLAQRPFRENKAAFILFHKFPFWQYLQTDHQGMRRWWVKLRDQWALQREFTASPNGRYYQRNQANRIYYPNPLHTTKPLYLLIDSDVASAASMFAAMVRGNTDAVVIGEETMGGYYGHTGHTSIDYRLPHTGIITHFALVDLEQDVPVKPTQLPGRGIMPDYQVTHTYDDFLASRDTQLNYTEVV